MGGPGSEPLRSQRRIVENRGKSHVLLLTGEILLGGKQNRVLMEDTLLPPMSGPRHIGVYCVEQGRWSGRRQEFEAKESFAAPGLRSQVMQKADVGETMAGLDLFFDPGLFAREWPNLLRVQALDIYRQPQRPIPDESELLKCLEFLMQAATMAEGTSRPNAGVGTLFEYRLERPPGLRLGLRRADLSRGHPVTPRQGEHNGA